MNSSQVPDVGATRAFVGRWWACLEALSDEERAKILQFSTGLSHLPAGGFRRLQPRFKLVVNIHLLGSGGGGGGGGGGGSGSSSSSSSSSSSNGGGGCSIPRLPTAHTCFNTIEVPPYATVEELRAKLMLAVTEGSGSFGFA